MGADRSVVYPGFGLSPLSGGCGVGEDRRGVVVAEVEEGLLRFGCGLVGQGGLGGLLV